jgi:hypothetical protein
MSEIGNALELEHEKIGQIISDEYSPSFELFKFKALYNRFVSPGTIVGAKITENNLLIGRVTASHEQNPHFLPKAGSSVIIPIRETITQVLGIRNEGEDGLHIGNLASTISVENELLVILNREVIQRLSSHRIRLLVCSIC